MAKTKGANMPNLASKDYNQLQQDRLLASVKTSLSSHSRIMAIRVDCRYPDLPSDKLHYGNVGTYSDSDISRFVASLKAKLDADLSRKEQAWGRKLKNQLSYAWAREIGPKSHKPHYHLMFFVNKDIYHGLGDYKSTESNLGNMIREAWCSALGLPMQQFAHLVSFPTAPLLYVDVNSPNYTDQVSAVLQRGSYLCKTYSKQAEAGYRAFGTSRLGAGMLRK